MSEQADQGMRTLKRAIETATGSSPSNENIIAILKGKTSLSRPVAAVLARTSLSVLNEIGKASGIVFDTIHETYCAAIGIEGGDGWIQLWQP